MAVGGMSARQPAARLASPRRGNQRQEVTGKVQQEPRFTEGEVTAALGGPVSHLGSGTFGDTWRHGSNAIKIICGEFSPGRLQREVGGLSRVSSPYVVKLKETSTVTLRGREWPALVFEYIAGNDVAKRIAAGQLPSAEEGEAFLRGLLSGVGHMHEKSTVHRDIKPANIALRDDDWSRPVLLDLGMARGAGEATITMNGTAVGTLVYMAPEVLYGHGQRDAADLFAVGVTVREALGGRHPFCDPGANPSPAEMIRLIGKGPGPLPAGVPARVEQLLDRLTSSRKAARGSAASCLRWLSREGAAA
jgi:eukaryotic-like serine/threonine-protein kinase